MESSEANQETAANLEWSFTPEQEEVLIRRSLDMVKAAADTKTVIFLDKSARPLSQLFRKIFPQAYPEKEMPKILFVNLGTEKISALETAYRRSIDGNEFPDYLRNIQDVINVYGKESVASLQKILSSKLKENRLVIDDTYQTGDTSRLANIIINQTDPKNEYSFFPFLASGADKAKFPSSRNPNVTIFPWHAIQTGVETPDEAEKSFVSQRPRDLLTIRESRQVRTVLDRIAEKAMDQIQKAA